MFACDKLDFEGPPLASAVALGNLDILEKLYDLPTVGDVRGSGFFYGIELVKDKNTRETFDDRRAERLLWGSSPTPSSTLASTAVPTTGAIPWCNSPPH